MRGLADRRLGLLASGFRKKQTPERVARKVPAIAKGRRWSSYSVVGDRREPLPQILRAGRGMQLAGIRLPGRNVGPHNVAFALGVGPGLEVVHGAEQVIALAPAWLAGPLLQLG